MLRLFYFVNWYAVYRQLKHEAGNEQSRYAALKETIFTTGYTYAGRKSKHKQGSRRGSTTTGYTADAFYAYRR